jgi:hypothetical protein
MVNNNPNSIKSILNANYSSKNNQRFKRPSTTNQIMNELIRITHPLTKIANRALINLPTPTNIRAS